MKGKFGIERASYSIEPNDHPSVLLGKNFHIDRVAPAFIKYAPRAPFASEKFPPNAARFDLINRSPGCLSSMKHTQELDFDKYTRRNIN